MREILGNPVLRELPVEMELESDNQDMGVQTEHLDLFLGVDVIEVPLVMEVIQKLDQTSFIKVEESEPQQSETNKDDFSKDEEMRMEDIEMIIESDEVERKEE